jgi:serine-type D-Ala-D-Ala carboxypeptidase (penicillin-binding protein 5/6)
VLRFGRENDRSPLNDTLWPELEFMPFLIQRRILEHFLVVVLVPTAGAQFADAAAPVPALEPQAAVATGSGGTSGHAGVAASPSANGPQTSASSAIANKQPSDSLHGRPFVTAKAWAIADGRTGHVLWGHQESKRVDIASTTKIMTALVIVRLAAKDSKILDETVIFSKRADETIGSSAGVKAGERVSVSELLYGLLLPSGNDASVAFAEHFGGRAQPATEHGTKSDPLPRFIAEMNRTAAELELHDTHFINPNGLTAADHRSSARDLARLTHIALQNRLFAAVVATPTHESTVADDKGQKRSIVWTNTNDLLKVEGYDGVKTGTTNAAGACLVASGHRGDDHLIIVILGAGSSDARYADVRNLFRWAWLERGHKESMPQANKPSNKTE